MTTKEAADKFQISEREVRKLAKEQKILGVIKNNGVYIIPDDTAIIITDSMARAFLLKLLKLKNNPAEITSTHELADKRICRAWYDYLQKNDLVGNCRYTSNPMELMKRMQLTDKGIEHVVGKKAFIRISSISVSPVINIASTVASASVFG